MSETLKINLSVEEKTNLIFNYLLTNDIKFQSLVNGVKSQFKNFKEGETVFVLDNKKDVVGLGKIIKFNSDGTVMVHYNNVIDWPFDTKYTIYYGEMDSEEPERLTLDKIQKQIGVLYHIKCDDYFLNGKKKKSVVEFYSVFPPEKFEHVVWHEKIENHYYDAEVSDRYIRYDNY